MASSSSSRKVARAARTGGGRRRRADSAYGWYAVMAVLAILGVSVVWYSRNERLSATDPGHTHPLATVGSRTGDNWLEAYGVYVCDKFLPPINQETDTEGLSTQDDGIIHISPFTKKAAGNNATVGRFAKTVSWSLTSTSVQMPGDKTVYGSGYKCGDKTAKFVVREWTNAQDAKTGKDLAVDPNSIRLKDKAAVVFAVVPDGTNIALPTSVIALSQAAANATPTPTTPTAGPGPTTPASPAAPASPTSTVKP